MNELDALVERVVGPVRASEARKEAMREELLGHLASAYDEELSQRSDPRAAIAAVQERFGDVGSLRRQLQAVVPWIERIEAVLRKEIFMRRWIWVIGWLVVIAAMMCVMPERDFRQDLIIVGIIGALGMTRLSQEPNSFTRWLGPRWGWRVIGVLFGVAVILPALAMYKHEQRSGVEVVVPVVLGLIMAGIGIGSFGFSVRQRLAGTAR